MRISYFFLLFFLIVCSCQRVANTNFNGLSANLYAHGFSIVKTPSYTKLSVFNPWENARNSKFDYYLIPEGYKNDSLQNKIIVPVKKAICLSTTHVAFLSELGETDKICGLSGAKYVSDPELNTRIEEGEVPDVGYDQNLNYELIVQLKPDVVFAYGVGNEILGFINRLKDLGIPVILNAEYLEQSPLGKTEWIKFIAPFFCKSEMGDSIFKSVETNYLILKKSVANCQYRPKVMTGMPYKDQWWVPGGKAYLATMLNDAGANYLWKENSSDESFVISPEQMIVEAEKADFWIHTGFITSLDGIAGFDRRFTKFAPYLKQNVFNNDLRMSKGGGNDFWESGVVHPDWILKDLITIFHPETEGSQPLYYYRKFGVMKENRKHIILIVSMFILLAVVFFAILLLGSVHISPPDILLALQGKSTSSFNQIVLDFRLPKALTAIIAGAALSVCGLQMQTVFRNPLSGPDVLGISSGASLGVAIMVLGFSSFFSTYLFTILGSWAVVLVAWFGAGAVLLLILLVSLRVRDIMTILILGILFAGATSSVVTILQYFSSESMLKSFVVWTMGSLEGVTSTQLNVLIPSVLAGLFITSLTIKQLDVMLLGDKYSASMGVNVQLTRVLVFLSTSILAGSITAFCGPIAFVGVAVPHLARMVFHTSSHKILFPACILIGAIVMLFSDIVAQMPGMNFTLPINAVTSILGIPLIIWIIMKNKKLGGYF